MRAPVIFLLPVVFEVVVVTSWFKKYASLTYLRKPSQVLYEDRPTRRSFSTGKYSPLRRLPKTVHVTFHYKADGDYDYEMWVEDERNVTQTIESTCGVSKVSTKRYTESRIIGGKEVYEGKWPWLAAIAFKLDNEGKRYYFKCGGTLISNKFVLTAAHCVVEEVGLFFVRLGVVELYGNNGVDVLIDRAVPHENFSFDNWINDIAILHLKTTVEFNNVIQPACLPLSKEFKNPVTSDLVITAGWGTTAYHGKPSKKLLEITIPITDYTLCGEIYNELGTEIGKKVLCSGLQEGGKDACQGDSGGPLFWAYKNVYYVVGVVSFGHNCGLPNIPGVYTKVSAYVDWISNEMTIN